MRRLTLLSLCLLASACQRGAQDPRAAGPRQDLEPRTVTVAKATPHALPRTIRVSGTLAADEEAALGFKVPGRVAETRVDLGSRVAKGDVVARLDATDFELRVLQSQAALEAARARLGLELRGEEDRVDADSTAVVAQARALLEESRVSRERVKELVAQKLRADSDLDAANALFEVNKAKHQDALEEVKNRQSLLSQRRAELALARQAILDTELKAPFDGAVRERAISPGQFVAAGASVVTLVKTHPLRLRLLIPEREAAPVRIGQPVTLSSEGDQKSYTGTIARISPAIGETNRTLLVEAEVANETSALRPGTFARASILITKDEPALCVPAAALVTFAGIEKVILDKDGKALERRVRTGRRDEERIEVLEGIADGDLVVLTPGSIVTGQPLVVRGG